MIAIVVLLALPSLARAGKLPDAAASKTEMVKRWKAKFPDDKQVEAKQHGDAVVNVDHDSAGREVTRATIPFKVTVTRDSGAAVYDGFLNYVLAGSSWVFESVGVGDYQDVAAKDQEAPPRPEVKALVKKHFAQYKPTKKFTLAPLDAAFPLQVEDVKVSDGRFLRDTKNKRWGYHYYMDVVGTDSAGKRWSCKGFGFIIEKPDSGGAWITSAQQEMDNTCD